MPPGPMRATGMRDSARPTIFSIRSSRPKQALGGGGGDSPDVLDYNVRHWANRRLELQTASESRPE